MKKLTCLLAGLTALSLTSVFAQSGPASGESAGKAETHEETTARAQAVKTTKAPLTKFDLDFPGGTPSELVAAIQKAMGRPLNAIVPVEYADWKLPRLKMNGVNAAQLFSAIEQSGMKKLDLYMGNGGYSHQENQSGFHPSEGTPSDDTVWYFYAYGEGALPKISRFYYLAPYLEGGLTVNDITTAIQTGWRLRGDASPPTLSFHQETKLLIAVGTIAGLDVIEQVLKALDAVKARPAADKSAAEAKTKP